MTKDCLTETFTLNELYEHHPDRFESLAKQYYDLFSYHAEQRMKAFNFFILSLSFFSTAYATLITKSGSDGRTFSMGASALALAAYFLVIGFARLDKRNEEIVHLQEMPLKRIQAVINAKLPSDGGIWETFRLSERSYYFRSFGDILPFIYCIGATVAAAGSAYALWAAGHVSECSSFLGTVIFSLIAGFLVYRPVFGQRGQTH